MTTVLSKKKKNLFKSRIVLSLILLVPKLIDMVAPWLNSEALEFKF